MKERKNTLASKRFTSDILRLTSSSKHSARKHARSIEIAFFEIFIHRLISHGGSIDLHVFCLGYDLVGCEYSAYYCIV